MHVNNITAIKLPRLVLALASHDREEFYKKLNGAGTVFLIEEDRHWLITSFDLVSRLFREPNLSSGRPSLKKLMSSHGDKFSVKFFYESWLMYMDGSEHSFWRDRFIVNFPKKDNHPLQYFEMEPLLIFRDSDFDICEVLIKPFVIHSLASVAGIDGKSLDSAYRLLKPMLQVLHGRGQKNISDEGNLGLDAWPVFIKLLLSENKIIEGGFLHKFSEQGDEIRKISIGLLPFIDVLDSIVTLCARVITNFYEIRSENNPEKEQATLFTLIRLYSPFQICNRQVTGPLKDLPGIDFRIGDKVSLLIGAANRDSSRWACHGSNANSIIRNLSFGIGQHSCPGRSWTTSIVTEFYNLLTSYLVLKKKVFLLKSISYSDEFGFMGIESINIQFENAQLD